MIFQRSPEAKSEDNYNKQRSDNKTYHREERVNLGNPGGNPTIGTTTVDLINALDLFKSNGDFNSNDVRDLIRFRIEAVDSDKPDESDSMVFRAFLDSFGDNYNASHNNIKYNGRGEEFYTYNSFTRKISFSFKIVVLELNLTPEYLIGYSIIQILSLIKLLISSIKDIL